MEKSARMISSRSLLALRRNLSTRNPKVVITPEMVAASDEKAETLKRISRKSAYPTTFTRVIGAGKDLSLPENPSEIAVLSGMPKEHQDRTVVIGPKPTKTLSSGRASSHQWELQWKKEMKFPRWTNPLMGWTSSADPMSTHKLTFDSSEDAVAFAVKQGWKYVLKNPTSMQIREPGSAKYADNFLSKQVRLRVAKGEKVFENPAYGSSNWFMPITYHGNQEVDQFGPKN